MKKSKLTFAEGFEGPEYSASKTGNTVGKHKAFDWDKAAEIIKNKFIEHPDLMAEAGLQDDWENTGGVIFEDGKPTNDEYTYLCSNWATPTLILNYDGEEQEEIECFAEESDRLNSCSKWDEVSIKTLGIEL